MVRLDKYLSSLGMGTRDQVKKMIRNGRIVVNGSKNVKPETKISETDEVLIDGEPLIYSKYEYILLNKPMGYITARNDPKKPVVMSLIESGRKELSPVGRLDEDTEGLLLITDDGELNHRLLSPKYHVDKVYYVTVDADFPENASETLSKPIEFQDFTSKPAVFKAETARTGFLTLTEGKFHEVKRLMHYIGCEVTALKRVSFGPLTLEGLKTGASRKLTQEEVDALYAAAGLTKE